MPGECSYYSSDGQRCRDDDAHRLAEALGRFLSGAPPLGVVTPAEEEREQLRQFITATERNFAAALCHPVGEAGAWLGSDEGRVFLRGFVLFCRNGAFELW